MKTDIQIAQEATMEPIVDVAEKIGLSEDDLEMYGKYKAKIKFDTYQRLQSNKDSKLILTTCC